MKDWSPYIISDSCSIRQALVALNELSSQVLTLFVVNHEQRMCGSLTDGDIRRALILGASLDDLVQVCMQRNFHYVNANDIDVEKIKKLKQLYISLVPCLDSEKRIVKIINLKNKKSILPLDAVLMAGGKGERLKPLTEHTPKPLLQVGNKAIIDYNVDRLISYGVEHISVTVNYLKEQIESHFSEPRLGVAVQCVREDSFLGTIGAVQNIAHFYHDVVLIMNSDLFTNIDFEDFYLHFKQNNADMSVAAIPYSVSIPYGIFRLDGRNIRGVDEKPSYNYYANAGIYLVKRELLDMVPRNTVYNATDLIEALVALQKTVVRFPIIGYWLDIGKHEDFQKAQELVKHV